MLFAEIDADGWVKIIGSIGSIVIVYFQWRMWMTINTIKKQTNSLTQQLVDETDKAANQQGRLDERARADAEEERKEVAKAVVEALRLEAKKESKS